MKFIAKTPVKYRGRRIEIGEEVEAFKKDKELLENYGTIIEDKKPAKKKKATVKDGEK